jgi:zinc/manganese transport system permease protein
MSELITVMAAPLTACLIFVAIHAYLGTHILARGVIFVDLALAQVAAMGSTLALMAGYGMTGGASYLVSLLFALFGAAYFSITRFKHRDISQEAVIGVAYVIASAVTILILDRAPHGAEHIKYMLVGTILWTDWWTVLKIALLYAAVGAVLFAVHRPIHSISYKIGGRSSRDRSVVFWDFVFYALFGLVVTSSVRIAGVLLVFSFLVMPALFSTLFFKGYNRRLAIGWLFGGMVSVAGCLISYYFDLPTGASIICTFGLVLNLAAVAKRLAAPVEHA